MRSNPAQPRRFRGWLTLMMVMALLVAACGDGDDAAASEESVAADADDTGEEADDAGDDADEGEGDGECVAESDLDERFCDRTGDMLADPPEDESDYLDPDELIFSYTPVEDPSVYEDAWADFLDYLGEETGKDIQFFSVENYAAQLEALRAGRLHVAGVNTGSVPNAVREAGFRPFAIMAGPDGYGYEMEIIVPADSDIEDLDQVQGEEVAMVSETSNSGFRAPTALLEAEFGMVAYDDYDITFTGRHDNSIMGVDQGDYEVAAIANSAMGRMASEGVIDMDNIRTIYTSETFPTTAYGYVSDLDPELGETITQAFIDFDWSGTGLEEAFGEEGDDHFMEIEYATEWEVIRQIEEVAGEDLD